jgi:ATP-dependent Clp protease, protease subunit
MNKLMQFLKQNGNSKSAITCKDDAGVAHLYLYDAIDAYWGASAAMLAEQLSANADKEIVLHVNSPGGDVFEARAMKALIASHKKPVTAIVEGLAASAATSVCNACASVQMSEDSMYMIHEAWTVAMGNKGELQSVVDLLSKVDDQIVNEYVKRTGKTADEVQEMMKNETWFTAQEAKEFGFCDEVVSSTQHANSKNWNLSAYKNAPQKNSSEINQKISGQSETNRKRLALLLQD